MPTIKIQGEIYTKDDFRVEAVNSGGAMWIFSVSNNLMATEFIE